MKKTKLIIIATLAIILVLVAAYFIYKDMTTINDKELKAAIENLKKIDAKTVKETDYPKVIGKYYKNGITLIENYQCADVCPDNAKLEIMYTDIKTKEDCEKIEGLILVDPVWGIYRACTPKVE